MSNGRLPLLFLLKMVDLLQEFQSKNPSLFEIPGFFNFKLAKGIGGGVFFLHSNETQEKNPTVQSWLTSNYLKLNGNETVNLFLGIKSTVCKVEKLLTLTSHQPPLLQKVMSLAGILDSYLFILMSVTSLGLHISLYKLLMPQSASYSCPQPHQLLTDWPIPSLAHQLGCWFTAPQEADCSPSLASLINYFYSRWPGRANRYTETVGGGVYSVCCP